MVMVEGSTQHKWVKVLCKFVTDDILKLTHLSLASHKKDIDKQCRPRSDAAEHDI